jgi:hypothetical protein
VTSSERRNTHAKTKIAKTAMFAFRSEREFVEFYLNRRKTTTAVAETSSPTKNGKTRKIA